MAQSTYGVSPSTTPIYPAIQDSLASKSKLGNKMELPGLMYNQYVPTAATISSGTVTNSGLSMIGALQLGSLTSGTLPLGGTAVATFSSSSGLLATIATSSFMPTTLNYDQFPVVFTTTTGTLPTGITAGTVYYWQWKSATTGNLSLTPNGAVIAYTDAGSGTIYCQAASAAVPGAGYYGSPWIPAGFFAAQDNMYNGIMNGNGATFRIEIFGHKIGTGTNTYTITPGLVAAGSNTFTALTAGSVLAAVNAGPFPFSSVTDIQIQQYGTTTAPIAIIKTVNTNQVFSTATTNTWSTNVFAKTVSVDVTSGYALDVRYIATTPVVGEYMEPLSVRIWAFN
jgi:hypothetical protein